MTNYKYFRAFYTAVAAPGLGPGARKWGVGMVILQAKPPEAEVLMHSACW